MSPLKEKPKKSKQSINDKASKSKVDRSKETIKEISEVNKKHIAEVLDSTKKIVDSIKQKLDQQEIEDTFIDTIESTIEDSAELVEEVVDAVVNSFNNQVEMNMDFETEQAEILNETNTIDPQKMLELLQGNFEKSREFTINNTKLAVNTNQKLVESINSQIGSLLNLQKEGLDKYKTWVSEMMQKKE